MSESKPSLTTLKTRLRLSRPMPSLYAHQMAVQIGEDEVILSFFETFLPYLVNATPEEEQRLQDAGIPAECIARISISKRRFHEFADVLARTSQQIKELEQASQE